MKKYEKNENIQCKRKKWTVNIIGDEGSVKISESLMTNTTLTKLNLGGDDNIKKNGKNNNNKEMKNKM